MRSLARSFEIHLSLADAYKSSASEIGRDAVLAGLLSTALLVTTGAIGGFPIRFSFFYAVSSAIFVLLGRLFLKYRVARADGDSEAEKLSMALFTSSALLLGWVLASCLLQYFNTSHWLVQTGERAGSAPGSTTKRRELHKNDGQRQQPTPARSTRRERQQPTPAPATDLCTSNRRGRQLALPRCSCFSVTGALASLARSHHQRRGRQQLTEGAGRI